MAPPADQLTLSQTGGQIMPHPRIFRTSNGPAITDANVEVTFACEVCEIVGKGTFIWTT